MLLSWTWNGVLLFTSISYCAAGEKESTEAWSGARCPARFLGQRATRVSRNARRRRNTKRRKAAMGPQPQSPGWPLGSLGARHCTNWVCLKMLCTPKPNGFADHYPYWMAISLGIYPIFRQTQLIHRCRLRVEMQMGKTSKRIQRLNKGATLSLANLERWQKAALPTVIVTSVRSQNEPSKGEERVLVQSWLCI